MPVYILAQVSTTVTQCTVRDDFTYACLVLCIFLLPVATQRGLPVKGLPAGMLLGILDDLFAATIAWIKGANNLAQSVFTCLYTHNVALIEDPCLKAYVIIVCRVVSHVYDLVSSRSSA